LHYVGYDLNNVLKWNYNITEATPKGASGMKYDTGRIYVGKDQWYSHVPGKIKV